jgi:hypothetical protein
LNCINGGKKVAKIEYKRMTRKQWERAVGLVSTPNVASILSKLKNHGPNAIVPAGDVLSGFAGIGHVNKAFRKNKLKCRLRIVQSGYRVGFSSELYGYPDGYLLQIALKKPS